MKVMDKIPQINLFILISRLICSHEISVKLEKLVVSILMNGFRGIHFFQDKLCGKWVFYRRHFLSIYSIKFSMYYGNAHIYRVRILLYNKWYLKLFVKNNCMQSLCAQNV